MQRSDGRNSPLETGKKTERLVQSSGVCLRGVTLDKFMHLYHVNTPLLATLNASQACPLSRGEIRHSSFFIQKILQYGYSTDLSSLIHSPTQSNLSSLIFEKVNRLVPGVPQPGACCGRVSTIFPFSVLSPYQLGGLKLALFALK